MPTAASQVTAISLIEQDSERVVSEVGDSIHRLCGKTLLLTGANGFLASYLVDTVAWMNQHVFSSPCRLIAMVRSPITPSERLGHLLGRGDVQFIQQDVCAPVHLDGPINFVVHAASKASPKDYLAHPLETMDANVIGTRLLLDLVKAQRTGRVLFLSSGEIYGNVSAQFIPIQEDCPWSMPPTDPRACYAESKRYGEALCLAYWREYQVPVNIARTFHVYGPGLRLDDGRVMADFFRHRLENTPLRVLSDGSGVRAFCYVSDAVTGFLKLLLSDCHGEVVNIGNDQEPLSVRELALLIATLEDPQLPVKFQSVALPEHLRGSPSQVCPDISKARRLLHFEPRVGLREGLCKTLQWHRACLGRR